MDELILEGLPKNDETLNKIRNPVQSALKGADTAIMDFVDDTESSAGRGLNNAGANTLGRLLMDDANNHKKLTFESNEPYAKRDPRANKLGEIVGDGLSYYAVGRALGAGAAGGAKVLGSASLPTAAKNAKLLSEALNTGGFSNKILPGLLGGATVGGVHSAIKHPDDPGAIAKDAIMGAVLPFVFKHVTNSFGSTPEAPPPDSPLSLYKEHGYKVAPSMDSDSGFLKRLINGYSGKIQTEQHLAQVNQAVTNTLARRAIGLAEDTGITPDELRAIRKGLFTAGYGPVREIGHVKTDSAYRRELDDISKLYRNSTNSFPGFGGRPVADLTKVMNVPNFLAEDALDAIRLLRADAKKSFSTRDDYMGKAQLHISRALESQLERALEKGGPVSEKILAGYRHARKSIAKTHAVEEALNPSSGDISASKLGALLKRGVPLSDELKVIADFANTYPKVSANRAAPLAYSPLDFAFGSTSLKALSLAAGRPLARKYIIANAGKIPKSKPAMSPDKTAATEIIVPSSAHSLTESNKKADKPSASEAAPHVKSSLELEYELMDKKLDEIMKENDLLFPPKNHD